jgi:hypothetical protein
MLAQELYAEMEAAGFKLTKPIQATLLRCVYR